MAGGGGNEESVARLDAALDRLAPDAARIGLAVSGGPDSMALLLLAHAARPDRIAAATVDHGFRPEAAAEAAFVAGFCMERGIPHATLTVTVSPAGTGVQAAARAARYAALSEWCAARGIAALATAHHADDQAETLLMRLARGAGIAGLAGIRARRPLRLPGLVPGSTAPENPTPGGRGRRSDAGWPPGPVLGDGLGDITLIRPLLDWRRAELAAVVADAGIVAIDDPSNRDPRYDRTAARALLAAGNIDPARLAATAAHLAEAEAALDWAAQQAWRARVTIAGDARLIDPAGLPAELRRRLLLRAIATIGGGVPQGPDLVRLIRRIEGGGTATLASVVVRGGPRWRLSPEPPRRARR